MVCRLIKRFDSEKDGDLRLCLHRGVAYQKDVTEKFEYGDAYFEHYKRLEGTEVATRLNAGRCALLARHAAPEATVLDIGAGSGTFVRTALRWGFDAKGFDVIPRTVAELKREKLFASDADGFDVVTFWDSLEHIDDPETVLRRINKNAMVLVAIPIIEDLTKIRESKHYKPGEHLFYCTDAGFVDWMALHGFRLLERSTHEVDAGREAIGAYAFRRDLPDFHDHVAAYSEMHATRFYGSSATELHLATAARVVSELRPASILDFGCGRSDLVAHFWRDGERRIERYDPAIPKLKRMPPGRFDLVLCCDVLEHIPMAAVDRVLSEVKSKGDRAFFSISTKLARAKMPDGSNAHCTLLTAKEWKRWIGDVFGKASTLPTEHEHEVLVLAGPK